MSNTVRDIKSEPQRAKRRASKWEASNV